MKLSFVFLLLLSPGLIFALDITTVDDFGYQLQNYGDLSGLTNSSFDLIVMDYSMDGSESAEFSAADITGIRTDGPCNSRIVVAYLSIGEAENYRFYWDPNWVDGNGKPIPGVAPAWLGKTNPDWPGNYKVRYWDPAWQTIVISYLDRIIDQGYDGIYLDIIDAFEYWGPVENGGKDKRRDSAALMVDFVRTLADHARVTRGVPNFLVIPQNGAGIIADWTYPDAADPVAEALFQQIRYFEVINAIGAEDTFFRGNNSMNNSYNPDTEVIALLEQFRDGGKTVLCTDYVTRAKKVNKFYYQAAAHGFVAYATKRNLGKLTINAAFPPDCEP